MVVFAAPSLDSELVCTQNKHTKQKYPGKKPQTARGSGRIMYDHVAENGDDDDDDDHDHDHDHHDHDHDDDDDHDQHDGDDNDDCW